MLTKTYQTAQLITHKNTFMNKSRQFSFSQTNIEDIFQWLKKKVRKGSFPAYSDYSDTELLDVAQGMFPVIQEHLDVANDLAIKQIERLNKSDKTVLSSSKPLV